MTAARPHAWIQIYDGDPRARAIYNRHYSSRRYLDGRHNRPRLKIVGPGEYLMYITADESSLFVWRRFINNCQPAQFGVYCAVFHNGNPERYLSSELILDAEQYAWDRWPGARLYTFIAVDQVRRKRDPGRCFRKAGWRDCGKTKGGLLIMEKLCESRLGLFA